MVLFVFSIILDGGGWSSEGLALILIILFLSLGWISGGRWIEEYLETGGLVERLCWPGIGGGLLFALDSD